MSLTPSPITHYIRKEYGMRVSHSMVAYDAQHAALNIKVEGTFDSIEEAERKMEAFVSRELECPTLRSVLYSIIPDFDEIGSISKTEIVLLSNIKRHLRECKLRLSWAYVLEVTRQNSANHAFLCGVRDAVHEQSIDERLYYSAYAYKTGYDEGKKYLEQE